MKKLRLDHLIFERGLADSANQAQRLVMAGLVYVNGQKSDKAGRKVLSDIELEVRETLRYVSRGGLKLEGALEFFPFDAKGAICLDVGASTGGFTDCLLQNGAIKIYAVDVGHGQLHYRMQQDERVINLEKTHVRLLTPEIIPESVDVLVMDTSFISLERVLPPSWPFLKVGGWCVALIKPQFEVDSKHLKKGVVRDDVIRQQAVDKIVSFVQAELTGVEIVGVTESPIHGPKGNVEFLLGLRKL
ncbi:MAG: TlyA family rRNA (cytidine-2'-O)-methyltransferase [Proteobacteria bacterium]|nr:MAG: TlyA family rRNA (cytidine-2'-O)-methyltransferase [Pseudomonadota bacterium]